MTRRTETQLAESITRKARESADTIVEFFDTNASAIEALASQMAIRFDQGAKLLVMGNGGSSCDAEHICVEFMHPIFETRKSLKAIALTNNSALMTALANDIDFSTVFTRQLELLAEDADMVIAISTSGMSANLIDAVKYSRARGMMTIAFLGRDGGRMADLVDHSFIVPSFSIHRIQEVHVALLHMLWDTVHLSMGEEDLL